MTGGNALRSTGVALGNGAKVLDAIAALANTFGGIVLVGVDEDQPPGLASY